MRTGACISVPPSTVNGTELKEQKWKDSLFLRYVIDPPDLPEHSNECGAAFDIYHELNCDNGGLIMICHNKIRDGVADLASKSFTPQHVHDDPKFYTGCTMHGRTKIIKGLPLKYVGELKGGLLIRDVWMKETGSIHNMHVVSTDATSYRSKSPEKCLETADKVNKDNHLDA